MLLCVACRNGDIPAKLCMKSLEEGGVPVLHENLRLKRKERGLSQEELASRLHVVRQNISKWEKGMSVPDSEQTGYNLSSRNLIWDAGRVGLVVSHNGVNDGDHLPASVAHGRHVGLPFIPFFLEIKLQRRIVKHRR